MDEIGRESDSAPRNRRLQQMARIRLCSLRSPRDTVSESALTARSVNAPATASSTLMDLHCRDRSVGVSMIFMVSGCAGSVVLYASWS